jgi:DNA-directed RNA polymerase specialized sigma24 family protein
MTNTTEQSDEALVGLYVNGDATAFDQLYRRHELRVWRYLDRNLRDQASSDELLQEIWFALARNAASLESSTRFRTRLFTLAHDRMTSTLQARPAQETPPSGDALSRALGELPREQRESYLLQIEGQLSVGEIAEIAESTIDATQSSVRLARLKLRELLAENPGEASSSQDPLNEADHLYRRLSAADQGRPGEWVRRKVQAYSAQQAAERAVRDSAKGAPAKVAPAAPSPVATVTPIPKVTPAPVQAKQQAAKKPAWLLPVGLAAVVVVVAAAVVFMPSFGGHHEITVTPPPPAPITEPEAATPQMAQASAPSASDSTSSTSTDSTASAPASQAAQTSEPAAVAAPEPAIQPPAPTPPAPRPSAPPAVATSNSARVARNTPAPATKAQVARQSAAPAPSPSLAMSRPDAAPPAVQPAGNSAPVQSASAPAAAPQQAPAPQTPPPVAMTSTAPAAATPAPDAAGSSATDDELYRAAQSGDRSGLQAALAGNVDVNAYDAKGHTALILAIQHGQVDIVKTLLAHGANPNKADSKGTTPLGAAYSRGNFEILKAVQRAGAGRS